MEKRRKLDNAEAFQGVRRGWCLGTEEFRRELLQRMNGGLKRHHSGALRRESAQVKASQLLARELKRRGWKRKDLESRRKGDPEKIKIAGACGRRPP